MDKQELIDLALAQIEKDVMHGDLTAIEELLRFAPEEKLKNYLPESRNEKDI